MSDNDDDNPSDPGWVKKSTGLWQFTGEKGEENPYKETDDMTDEEYVKHEEHLQQMERDEIKRLKNMGCLPEDYDDDSGCPGCGESILPRHHDEFMKKSFMQAECSVCNIGFTDITQEYTEFFQYFGGVEIKENYRSYPEIPEWTKWKCPFHPDGHVAVTMVDSSPMVIERIGKDGEMEYVSKEYDLPTKDQDTKKDSDIQEADNWAKELEAKQQAANARRAAVEDARIAKFRVSKDRENEEGDGLNPWL